MDQLIGLHNLERQQAVERLSEYVAASVDTAPTREAPFLHLEFERVFPDDVSAEITAAMREPTDSRRMSGRRKVDVRDDGTPTRVKIDLFPEYIRNLPPDKRALWTIVGGALCS